MAHNHPLLTVVLLSPLLLSISLPISEGSTSSAGRPHLFWVAANKTQCSNYSNGSDCDTLDRYLGREDVNFSLSDTTWIFLHGEHVLSKQINITLARNVTLTGEKRCKHTAVELKCDARVDFNASGLEQILIRKSKHITIKNISLNALCTRGVIKVDSTSDFCINDVFFPSKKDQEVIITITNPFGHYMLMGSMFGDRTNLTIEFDACLQKEGKCIVSFTISQCQFKSSVSVSKTALQMHLPEKQKYHSITMNISDSTFSKCYLNVSLVSYPTVCYYMELNGVNFSKRHAGFQLSAPLSIQGHNESALSNLPRAQTVFHNCTFHDVLGASLDISLSRGHDLCETLNKSIQTEIHYIYILNSLFSGSRHTNSAPFTVSIEVQGESWSACNCAVHHQLHTLLTIKQTTFTTAKLDGRSEQSKSICIVAALFLKNLQGYRVVMAGENQIVSSEGYGLMLENSQVELQGYNEISNNTHARGGGGGIHMSSDSQLLLMNNSHLNVSGNTGMLYGGGIYVSYAGSSIQTLNKFVDCYIEKLTCPGWCFFQFINSDGQYVNASDIAEHNATVTLSNNTATHAIGWENVFNGHLQNCSLRTSQDTILASEELVSVLFHQNSSVDKGKLPSYPYFICLCNDGENKCIQNYPPVLDTYPVKQFPILVNVMGDWQQAIPVTFRADDAGSCRYRTVLGCSEVHTLGHLTPGSSHHISLQASLQGDNVVLVRKLVVNVFNSCAPGLVYNKSESSCVCNATLRHHSFTCVIKTNTTTYKTKLPHYWIGMKGKHLIVSPNCPLTYCNSDILQSGLTLDNNTQNLQCTNGHRGLLCSECPSGYSSVFGTFKCKQCSSVWLLQLPLYALSGIFIVALLFLLNLTLLQGTVLGVMLYANIMELMTDFIQEHARGPLFFLLSVLNLQSGAGLCFYNGMDQFAKALLQFVFPCYLFTLLIVIIIVTHKCGYRMFRKAHFIARRAVPVLATIMVLTYTSLVSAVTTPLRYTTILNADTAQGETVWLYQPSLPFFGGQHFVIGILSITVIVLYLIPFTFTMLFGDLMRRYIHKLWFSHFMDVFHGGFRWPLGFWIGLRLLVRVILVIISVFTGTNTAAYCTLAIAGTLLIVQLLAKPFRNPNQFRVSAVVSRAYSPAHKVKCIPKMKKFFNTYHTPLLDTLYLLNIVFSSVTVAFGSSVKSDHGAQKKLFITGVNILILLALVQFAVILVYHAYNFFPVPERARSCAQSCWSTMRAIPSMLKDTQCCQRGPREEEEHRRSPIPILILRPPEIDESYDSTTETNSYCEQPPPEEVQVRESSLQEPLLTHTVTELH